MTGINWMIAKAEVKNYVDFEGAEMFFVSEGYFSGKLPARLTSSIHSEVKSFNPSYRSGVSNWAIGNTTYALKTGVKMSTKDAVDFTFQTIEVADTQLWTSGD